MRPTISLFSLCVLLLIAMFSASIRRLPAVSAGEAASARFMTEVRLRKLHLVRPDLIPYPIETEVYC